MRTQRRVRALVLAGGALALSQLGFDEGEFTLTVNVSGEEVRFHRHKGEVLPTSLEHLYQSAESMVHMSEPGRPEQVPAKGRWLSPTEEKMMAILSDGKWMSGEHIARTLAQNHTKELASVLTNLVDRDILQSQAGKGYRLWVGDCTSNGN